jgi:hypothetical protein
MNFSVPLLDPIPTSQTELSAILYNLLQGSNYDFSSSNFPNRLQIGAPPYFIQILSTTAGMGSSYNDGVYRFEGTFLDSTPDNLYESETYFLKTTVIDAGIAAYPQATFFDRANLITLQYLREQIDVAFAAEDYTLTNTIINDCLAYLGYGTGDLSFNLSAITQTTDSNLFLNVVANQATLIPTICQYNEILNTRTSSVAVFTNQSLVPSGIGSMNINSTNTYFIPYYTDAVFQVKNYYASPSYLNEADNSVSQVTGYIVITTSIDSAWELFQEYYDPTNASQLAAYNAILAAYEEINTLSSDIATNFAAINAEIVIIENLLALFINLESTLTLPSINTLLITLPNVLPNLTYSNQTGTVTNTSTGAVFSFSGFPQSYVDLTFEVSSEDLNMGEQIEDAVYQSNVDFENSLDQLFNAQAYCLVTTFIDCGIAGLIAKRPNCKPIFSQLNTLMTYKSMIVAAFNNQDYNNCNILIKKCIGILKKDGCNCGCS